MELAAHLSLTELISDWSKRQSCGELKTRKILRSSAKIKHLLCLIELHRSLMNTLKREALEQNLVAHRKLLEKVGREYQKREPDIACWLSNCETS
jgi:hypothetical protein